jgi:hypothetical protein
VIELVVGASDDQALTPVIAAMAGAAAAIR